MKAVADHTIADQDIADRILGKARSLGADLAGFARVEDLRSAPSFTFAPKMPDMSCGIGSRESKPGLRPGEVAWPPDARSVLVIGVAHPREKPEMDWWFGRVNPPGNRILTDIVRELCDWITGSMGIGTVHLPYHVEKGGIYLKDAAVLAGFGCIGKNNILVTPDYGPRIRLRSLSLNMEIASTGVLDFDPCNGCAMPCRHACPQGAFNDQVYMPGDFSEPFLPGRTGVFSRPVCNIQMQLDNDIAESVETENGKAPVKLIKYCRRCELVCTAGRKTRSIPVAVSNREKDRIPSGARVDGMTV